MATTQTAISREVRRWMQAEHYTQLDVARRLGISQPQVSGRLKGSVKWSLDDLDKLWDLGVPIDLPAYGELAWSTPEVVR